ncbi:UNKNOWN [Stylonychia lemnae]|uniref:Uncharacterized protein n=1 Tax=Stylonychia lemnae TaxID=5949 RepID=A0A077ZV29_STYLE|nr:UNKNOWN [Stylonychia lemnae]|eukprot:CDW73155.1 UNKNOWN [Stylonychia lemnae]
MAERHIDPDKEQLIQDALIKLILEQQGLTLEEMEYKITEHLATLLNGETWLCRIQLQPHALDERDKPEEYLLDQQQLDINKTLLFEQGKGKEKMMLATEDYKVFIIRIELNIDSALRNRIDKYFKRLSQYNAVVDVEVEKVKKNFQKLSYFEIACIAKYLDHMDIENFIRVSKSCHYSGCLAITQNIQAFKEQVDKTNFQEDEKYLKEFLQEDIDKHIDKEYDIERVLVTELNTNITNCYVQEDVLKRYKLWNVGQQQISNVSDNVKVLYEFLQDSIKILSIRENPLLQINKKMNACFQMKSTYLAFDIDKQMQKYSEEERAQAMKVYHDLPILNRMQNQANVIMRTNNFATETSTEKKCLQIISILCSENYKAFLFVASVDGKPQYTYAGRNFLNQPPFLRQVKTMPATNIMEAKKFRDKYGPTEREIQYFLRTQRQTENILISFINSVFEYFYKEREKLKSRSEIFRLILEQEESMHRGNFQDLQKYFKKYKPKLYEENFVKS